MPLQETQAPFWQKEKKSCQWKNNSSVFLNGKASTVPPFPERQTSFEKKKESPDGKPGAKALRPPLRGFSSIAFR